jgi:hypothetical protein
MNLPVLFGSLLPDKLKIATLYEFSQAAPACPSDKSNIKMKISMEQ